MAPARSQQLMWRISFTCNQVSFDAGDAAAPIAANSMSHWRRIITTGDHAGKKTKQEKTKTKNKKKKYDIRSSTAAAAAAVVVVVIVVVVAIKSTTCYLDAVQLIGQKNAATFTPSG